MNHRARSIAALAGALFLGATTLSAGTASAATGPRAAVRAFVRGTSRSAAQVPFDVQQVDVAASPSTRTITDGAFSVTRTIRRVNGSDRVVFEATDLRTGRTSTMNAAA